MEMIENPLVSVIIPVYNVEPYLDKCIETVRNQTYTNLEIILIDDGSKDASGRMCDGYGAQDDRIIVIHKENGGQSEARNRGLDIAKGDYITFVDSDDYVDVQMIELQLAFLRENNCDVVSCGTLKTVSDEEQAPKFEDWTGEVITQREALFRLFYRRKFPGYVCAKLFRAEIFKELRFPVGKIFEDVITTYRAMQQVSSVGILDYSMYYYRQNVQSTVHVKYQPARLNQVYYAIEMLEGVKGDVELERATETFLFFALMDNYTLIERPYRENKKFLASQIKKYRVPVLKNGEEGCSLRIMAFIACFPGLWAARLMGKAYKYVNWKKWLKEAKKYS